MIKPDTAAELLRSAPGVTEFEKVYAIFQAKKNGKEMRDRVFGTHPQKPLEVGVEAGVWLWLLWLLWLWLWL